MMEEVSESINIKNRNMKKMILMGSIVTLMLSSCGGSDCYRCKKNSYFNGISNTAPGAWAVYCKEKGESDADYEARISDLQGKNFTCEPK